MHADILALLSRNAVWNQATPQRKHEGYPNDDNWHTNERQLEHAHRRHVISCDQAADDDVGGGTDQRDRTGEDRGKCQRHQELGRAELCPMGQPNDDGEEKRSRCGIADECPHRCRGNHHDEEDLVRAGVRLAQNHTADKVGHTGTDQRLHHDQDAQYHDDCVAPEPGERRFDRQQSRDGQKQQDDQRGHIGGHNLQRKEHQSHKHGAQEKQNLYRHSPVTSVRPVQGKAFHPPDLPPARGRLCVLDVDTPQ